MPIAINPPSPATCSDWSDVASLQQKMIETVEAMSALGADVGMARQILSYESDRRKRALSRAMSAPLAGGESTNKAEAEARASDNYGKELETLARQSAAAEQTIMLWETSKLKWETCRSLLSMQKEGMRRL